MKIIRSIEYRQLDASDSEKFDCVVEFIDGTMEIFTEEEDLLKVKRQLQRQSRMPKDPLRP